MSAVGGLPLGSDLGTRTEKRTFRQLSKMAETRNLTPIIPSGSAGNCAGMARCARIATCVGGSLP